MASPNGKAAGGKEREIPPEEQQRALGMKDRLRVLFTGKAPDGFFGPGQPMEPVAQDEAHGRRFDFPFAVNMPPTPRGETGEGAITFQTLRRLADPTLGGLDLLRLAVETRKDQMAGQAWKVRARDNAGDGGERARAVEKALRRPDGVHSFRTWQRMLLEDALVLDAPVIYLRRTKATPALPAAAPLPAPVQPGQPPAPGDDTMPPQAGQKPSQPPGDGEEEGKAPAPQRDQQQTSNAPPPGKGAPPDDGKTPPPKDEQPPAADGAKPTDQQPPKDDEEQPADAAGADAEPGAPGQPPTPQPYKNVTAHDVGLLLELIDGATIKVLLGDDGRTPLLPDPAYVQQIKGMPATHYTTDEIVYAVRNPRTNRIYGFGPVEQVVSTVNIALRRQMSQLEFYTAGTVPDMILGVPETWNPDQIRDFQTWWDSLLTGNTAERRKARFVPGGTTPFPLKDTKVVDEWDEWLARVICYAFSLPYQALVHEVNRATAETAKESGQQEGLEPIKLWFKDVMDEVLDKGFGCPELEFVYADEEISDAKTKAEVWSTLVGAKIAKPSEARASYGLAPDPGLDAAAVAPPPSPFGPPGGGFGGDEEEEAPQDGPPGRGPPKGRPPPPRRGTPPPPPPNGDASKVAKGGTVTLDDLAALIDAAVAKAIPRQPPLVLPPPPVNGHAHGGYRFVTDAAGELVGIAPLE